MDSLNDLSVDDGPTTVDYNSVNEAEDFINDRYYDIIITDYMKQKVVDDLKESLKPNQKLLDENKRHIKNLRKEIDFLRGESDAKNRIIELLVKTKLRCKNCSSRSSAEKNERSKQQEKRNNAYNERNNSYGKHAQNNGGNFPGMTSKHVSREICRKNGYSHENATSAAALSLENISRCNSFSKTTEDMKRYIITYFLQNSDSVDIRFRQTQLSSKESELVVDLKELDNDIDNDSGTCNEFDYGMLSCVYTNVRQDQVMVHVVCLWPLHYFVS